MPAEASVLVFGAGAVGGYLGAKLALLPNVSVTLLGRAAMAEAVNRAGIEVLEGGGATRSYPSAITAPAGSPYDIVILGTRTYDLGTALHDLPELVKESGFVLCMQNGVGSDDRIAQQVGEERTIAGTVTFRLRVARPGVVERHGSSGGLALAALPGCSVSPWVVDTFRDAGMDPQIVRDHASLRWSKLLLNMLGSASGAVLDMDLADIMANRCLFRIEQLAFREATRVMAAASTAIVPLPGYPVPLAAAIMRMPCAPAQALIGPRIARSRGGQPPGMREDVRRGRSEIDAYNGAIAHAAWERTIPAPVNRAIAELVTAVTGDEQVRESYRLNPDRYVRFMRDHGARR